MVMKTNEKTSSLARVALGATAVLALAGRAHAVACAVNTYYDGTTKSGAGGVFNAAADCTACPTGMTAAAVPNGSARTYCEGIAANYYGSLGIASASNSVPTACATTFSGALAGSVVSKANSQSQTDCVTAPGYVITTARGGNAASTVTTALVAAGRYDAGGAILYSAATSTGTACPFAGTSTAGATHVTECTADCSTTTPGSNAVNFEGTCVCAAKSYGTPVDGSAGSTNAVTTGCTKCVTTFSGVNEAHLTSVQGSTTVAGCKTAPGYYVSVSDFTGDSALRLTIVPANKYQAVQALDGSSVSTPSSCPFAGTSPAGSAAVTACTPDCGTGVNAVAAGGTCECAAGAWGTPTGAPASGGCTLCTATWTSAVANSLTSPQGSTLRAECTVKPGYTITTQGVMTNPTTIGTQVVTAAAGSGKYYAAGEAVTAATTTASNCPFSGTTTTTTAGSVEECTPQCGAVSVNAVQQAGTCVCRAGAYGSPTGAPASGGCTACTATYTNARPNGITSAMSSAAKSACSTAPGYVISTARAGGSDALPVVTPVAANKYAAGGVDLDTGVVSTGTSCPANSASAVGSGKISDCKCAAGYSAGSTTCVQCPANTYHAGGDAVGTPTNCLGCAAGFTSAAGASSCTAVVTPTAPTTTSPTAPAGADEKSGSSTTSVIAAISAVAAAQFVL